MPRLLERQSPPAVPPPDSIGVDGLLVNGVDNAEGWRRVVRAHNAARQRAEAHRLAARYRAEVLADGRRLWTCGPAAAADDDGGGLAE